MRKKLATVSLLSDVSDRLPRHATRRIVLSREAIRTLTSDELSLVAGGCPTGMSSSQHDPVV
jgi:hypothetical protein